MFNKIKNLMVKDSLPNVEQELYDTFFKLNSAKPEIIKTLHLSLMQMWALFNSKYSGITDFAYKPEKEKFQYLERLLATEKEFFEKNMLTESVACKLLGLVLANTLDDGGKKRDMEKVVQVRKIFEHFKETGLINMAIVKTDDSPIIRVNRK